MFIPWVAPVNGMKQGQFEAAEFLVTPKTQQVITGGIDLRLSKESFVTADFARSRYDVNTLSTLDKGNDAWKCYEIYSAKSAPYKKRIAEMGDQFLFVVRIQ